MVEIRRAEREDIPGIKAVLAVTWRDTYSTFLSEASIAKVTSEWHSPRVLEVEIARPLTYIGVATSARNGIVAMISAHSQGEVLFVARMYVLPEFQRQGIGERMMDEACRAFPRHSGSALTSRNRTQKVGRSIGSLDSERLRPE